jgi:DNA-binding NarL/FixJ family response regulator
MGSADLDMPITRLAIAAAHELARSGLVAMATGQSDMVVVAEIADAAELERIVEQHRPDAVLVDFDTPEHRAAAAQLLRNWPETIVVAVGHQESDEEIRRALDTGVRGYLPKRLPAKEIFGGLRKALRRKLGLPRALVQRLSDGTDEPQLTTRECQVLELLADGRSNACIADTLGITVGTVKNHLKALLAKLGATDRTEATAMAFRRGFVQLH